MMMNVSESSVYQKLVQKYQLLRSALMRNISRMVSLSRTLTAVAGLFRTEALYCPALRNTPRACNCINTASVSLSTPYSQREQSVLKSDNGPQFEEWEFGHIYVVMFEPLQIQTAWTLTWNHMCSDSLCSILHCCFRNPDAHESQQ